MRFQNQIFPTENQAPWKNLELQKGHCLAEDVIAARDAASGRENGEKCPPVSPFNSPVSCWHLAGSNSARRQLARSLENTDYSSKPFPSSSDEKRRGKSSNGFEGKQLNKWHSSQTFTEKGHLMWVLGHEQELCKQEREKKKRKKQIQRQRMWLIQLTAKYPAWLPGRMYEQKQ